MSSLYAVAARAFAAQVRALPADAWDGPGVGEWDVRALVGHTSRSLVTVSTYLRTAAEREDVTSPEDYYARIRGLAASMGVGDIVERGRQAGRDLGADPVTAVDGLVARALDDVAAVDDPLITVIGGLGIRLSNYLPTRLFEFAVHGLDIARTTDTEPTQPADVLAEATALAARIAVAVGDGEDVLLTLTGRAPLPPGFSVV